MSNYVGNYRPLRALMSGQNSQIMECMNDSDGRRYVLKWLNDEHKANAEQIALLKNEYAVGKTLQHPRLIQVYELVDRQGSPCLVMEFFPSLNLKQKLRELGVDKLAANVESMLLQAAEGLQYLHSKGFIHRDVKPDNFLVNEANEVKLIDYALAQKKKTGLAKWFAGKSKIQGTVSYLSPEQIRGEVLDERSDVYSFGCMAFELLAGKLPFVGSSPNEVLQRHLASAAPTLESANAKISAEASALVGRMLAKKPALRPESMERIITELKVVKLMRKAGKK